MSDKLLPIRHYRFVQEFLKDGNATRAYIRAGFSRRGAQPSALLLLREPQVAAGIATGRRRLARAQEVAAERHMRIDRESASQPRGPGLIVLKGYSHRKQEKRVRPQPEGPAPRLTNQDRKHYEERCAVYERALDHRKREQRWLERQLEEARAALAEAYATIDAAGLTPASSPPGPGASIRPMENHRNRR